MNAGPMQWYIPPLENSAATIYNHKECNLKSNLLQKQTNKPIKKKKQSGVVYKLVTISSKPTKPLLFHGSYFPRWHRHILYNRRNASQRSVGTGQTR